MPTVFGETRFSGTSISLSDRLKAKELTLDEFLKECAYWALKDGFDELMPVQLPTRPTTNAFIEFEGLPELQKAKLDPDFFRKHYEIIEYYQQVNSITWRNKYTLDWLKEIKGYLPADDLMSLQKLDNPILEFRAWFDDNPVMIEKIKDTFQAKEVNPRRTPVRMGEIIYNDFRNPQDAGQ